MNKQQAIAAIKALFAEYAQTITDAQAEIIYSALQQVANKQVDADAFECVIHGRQDGPDCPRC